MNCSQPYAKIYASIFSGSLRGKADALLVFINLLVHADRDGITVVHPNKISQETGLSRKRVDRAIELLSSPDEESKSSLEEGRRLVLICPERPWGWKIVNHSQYRDLERLRESVKNRVRRHRERKALREFSNVNTNEVTLHPCTVRTSVLSTPDNTYCKVPSTPVPPISGAAISENALQSVTKRYESVTPPTNINVSGVSVVDGFEQFWQLYPRKSRIYDAQHAWVEVQANNHLAEILAAVKAQRDHEDWTKDGGKYIPHPANWLRDGRWMDVLKPAEKKPWNFEEPSPELLAKIAAENAAHIAEAKKHLR